MNIQKTTKVYAFVYGLPVLIILSSVLLALSPLLKSYPDLAIGITYDLTLTAPLVYLLLIRKKRIPRITAVPFFVLGLILATLLVPEHQKFHLGLITSYLLPVVEITVLSVIVYKVVKTIRAFKKNAGTTGDFYTVLKQSAVETLGYPKIATVFATEIAMIYYSFFSWRRKKTRENEFTYHKENGITALLVAIIFIMLIETVALHLLLIGWNKIVAWIFTISSIYAVLQLFGHIKAMRRRYSVIEDESLMLKYGLFGEATIQLSEIERVALTTKDINDSGRKVEKLALLKMLEPHNIVIYFTKPRKVEKIYGITKECDTLLLHIDDKEAFVNKVNNALQKYN